jgi:hypothetical protein
VATSTTTSLVFEAVIGLSRGAALDRHHSGATCVSQLRCSTVVLELCFMHWLAHRARKCTDMRRATGRFKRSCKEEPAAFDGQTGAVGGSICPTKVTFKFRERGRPEWIVRLWNESSTRKTIECRIAQRISLAVVVNCCPIYS